MTKEGTLEAEKKHRPATGQSVLFSSNEVRLSVGQWIFALGLVGVLLYLVSILWVGVEQFEAGSDYRFPYQLSNDYWLYSSYCRTICAEEKTVIIGDSVMWGQYVRRDQTLVHYLNELGGGDSFANLGIDGVHPAALCGLIEYYGGAISEKRVILHLNPLWMSSKKHDLQVSKEFRFNHPRLVPQFFPKIPCYSASISARMGIIIERNVPFFGWTRHLQLAYFKDENGVGRPLPAWAMAHPYDNPFKVFTLEINDLTEDLRYEPRPWTERSATKLNLPWVEFRTSLQWSLFQRLVKILKERKNTLLVLVGPLNEHMLNEKSLAAYSKILKDIEVLLQEKNISYYTPSVLPSEFYADVSHPLSEGYALLAEQLFDNDIGRGSW
ncbi:MAG: hypothetical protein ACYS9Y_06745 [Planctomycetota bacterium]|jgi:hypothetical protein